MRRALTPFLALAVGSTALVPAAAAQLSILLPEGRTAYQTNEIIDLTVVRSDAAALQAGTLGLTLSGADGSQMVLSFPAEAVTAGAAGARTDEHLHLNGWLLRPGHYTLSASADGAGAVSAIDIYSHIRKTPFKLIDWGSRSSGANQAALGEDSLGFNLLYANGGGDASVQGGLDYMGCCVMGGAHQMDLRLECDWSDPYVTGGGNQRVARAALQFRTQPNAIGVHYYDEPGLTWWTDPKTNEWTPHNIPSQDAAYRSDFNQEPQQYSDVKPNDPLSAAQWRQWATWKLGFMDAAWKNARYSVDYIKPDDISATQTQYGWTAFTDGYYFNIDRSMSVISGHGGYDDIGPGYFCPSFFLEMARARDLTKADWYLPAWYGNTPSADYRAEQYLSFITGIQGMAKPPDMQVHNPNTTLQADSIVETNKVMARLGPIFDTMPTTRQPVAVLYSLTNMIHQQIQDRSVASVYQDPHGIMLQYVYTALKTIQQPMTAIVDEDVMDGTLQANHKVVIVPAIKYLDQPEIDKLDSFVANGGTVLLAGNCGVDIKGAVNLGVNPQMPDQEKIDELTKAKKYMELGPYQTTGKQLQASDPLAKAIRAALTKAGIAPAFTSDASGISAGRQAYGDIEYLFAVNTTYDPVGNTRNAIAPARAVLSIPADGRPVYDALLGGPVEGFTKRGADLSGTFRFGAGEMRVFARTTRPIDTVELNTPVVSRDYTVSDSPIHLSFAASLVDDQHALLNGSAPLKIVVKDPLGSTRYDLYRATTNGVCQLSLPLAANDPAGIWTVTVQELLANTSAKASFNLSPTTDCGALAGLTRRAAVFGNDRDNIMRFFRNNKAVTLVRGTSDYDSAAADRVAAILKPWGVRSMIVNAADVNKPITLTEDEAKTWCGSEYAGRTIKAGGGNNPIVVGYDVPGAVVLIGTPADNPLIQALVTTKVLPYAVNADMPGPGRGMLAWQRDVIGRDIESIAVVAPDAAGMADAVGTLYEAATGMTPLTPFILPMTATVSPAVKADVPAALRTVWQTELADRAGSITVQPDGRLAVYTLDGTTSEVDGQGKVTGSHASTPDEMVAPKWTTAVPPALKDKLAPFRDIKSVITAPDGSVDIAYWGGTLQTFDAAGNQKTCQMLPQDIDGMAWAGNTLVVGLADGRVIGLSGK